MTLRPFSSGGYGPSPGVDPTKVANGLTTQAFTVTVPPPWVVYHYSQAFGGTPTPPTSVRTVGQLWPRGDEQSPV